jgi:NAD(P)H-hydrate repair Nnr-like enzyme with NAD(P)H-hydrate dehydratase domain
VELVQADRIAAAQTLAKQWNCVVILKGSGSVIAHADGTVVINTTGNPALATAGTGDVLAGCCGALLAQSQVSAWDAALASTWCHGKAADTLATTMFKNNGQLIGLTASELIPAVRYELNQLIH